MNWLIDMDGCIADNRHRLYHITGKNKDYKTFYENLAGDKPNIPLIAFLRNKSVVLLTGREEAYRSETLAWLSEWEFVPETLIMRPKGDYSHAFQFKGRILDELERERGFNPLNTIVIEDTPRVIQMYTERGYIVLTPFWLGNPFVI